MSRALRVLDHEGAVSACTAVRQGESGSTGYMPRPFSSILASGLPPVPLARLKDLIESLALPPARHTGWRRLHRCAAPPSDQRSVSDSRLYEANAARKAASWWNAKVARRAMTCHNAVATTN